MSPGPAIGQRTVLHVLTMNPNKRGPVEVQLLEMARQLRARDWRQVACFNAEPPAWYRTETAAAGGEVTWLPDPQGGSVGSVLELARGADVVHLHFLRPQPLAGALAGAGHRALVMTEHSFRPRDALSPLRALVRHRRVRPVRRLIGVSAAMGRQIRRDYLVGAGRIRVVHNGADLARFRPPDDRAAVRRAVLGDLGPGARVVAVAAHLHRDKRVDLLVRGFAPVAARLPGAQLVIAGNGDERTALERLIAELGLAGRARLLTGDNRVEEIYGAADVAALLSRGEGLGGGAVEALACGLPLVCTPNGGLAEVAEDGISGVFVRDPDPETVAAALHGLLADDALRARMGVAARRRAEKHFDVRRAAAATIAVYDEVLRE